MLTIGALGEVARTNALMAALVSFAKSSPASFRGPSVLMLVSFLIDSAEFPLRIPLAFEHRIELQTGLGVFVVASRFRLLYLRETEAPQPEKR